MPSDADDDAAQESIVTVWITGGEIGDAAHHRRLMALLTADEQARVGTVAHAGRRAELVVGRALLRTALARHVSVEAEPWPLRIDERGRPEQIAHARMTALRFNLTHTDGLVACSVTHGRDVGIDAERRRAVASSVGLARRFLGEHDADAIAAVPESQRDALFLRYWTLHEALGKARGTGLATAHDDMAFVIGPGGDVAFVGEDASAARWQCWQWDPTPEHTLAVCVSSGAGAPSSLRIEHVIL